MKHYLTSMLRSLVLLLFVGTMLALVGCQSGHFAGQVHRVHGVTSDGKRFSAHVYESGGSERFIGET
jgi:hypothetical protein